MTRQVPSDAATLPSGASMPLLGFGTWELDTATVYSNELGADDMAALDGLGRG